MVDKLIDYLTTGIAASFQVMKNLLNKKKKTTTTKQTEKKQQPTSRSKMAFKRLSVGIGHHIT